MFIIEIVPQPSPKRQTNQIVIPVSLQNHYLDSDGVAENSIKEKVSINPKIYMQTDSNDELPRQESNLSSNDPRSLIYNIKAIEGKGSRKQIILGSSEYSSDRNISQDTATEIKRMGSQFMPSVERLERVSELDELEEESKSMINHNSHQ